MGFDRYSMFRANGVIHKVPFVRIRKKESDRKAVYRRRSTRLDQMSSDFYGSPDYAWLIMQANPQYGSIEFFIPDGSELRIPYPLEETLNIYISDIENYKRIY